MDLKEYSIIETFRSMEVEKQRSLLEKLIKITKMTHLTIKFDTTEEETIHKFFSKQWPHMSLEFFKRALLRWKILMELTF